MELLLFIACGVVVLLCFEIYGVLISRGFGSYTRGVSRAWGARYELPADEQRAATIRGLQTWSSRTGNKGVWRRYPLFVRTLRGVILLVLLAGELHAGEDLFDSVWLGFIAWITTVLLSFAAM